VDARILQNLPKSAEKWECSLPDRDFFSRYRVEKFISYMKAANHDGVIFPRSFLSGRYSIRISIGLRTQYE
jgi:hypothetical protein